MTDLKLTTKGNKKTLAIYLLVNLFSFLFSPFPFFLAIARKVLSWLRKPGKKVYQSFKSLWIASFCNPKW